jgi:hypothetical protein
MEVPEDVLYSVYVSKPELGVYITSAEFGQFIAKSCEAFEYWFEQTKMALNLYGLTKKNKVECANVLIFKFPE